MKQARKAYAMMGIILVILALLLAVAAPILWIIFIIKRKGTFPGQSIGPLGPRRRDGVLTYNEYRGIRTNVAVEDPRDSHSPRYQRRHSVRQYKQTKPWMK
jgi:hypothetical protein